VSSSALGTGCRCLLSFLGCSGALSRQWGLGAPHNLVVEVVVEVEEVVAGEGVVVEGAVVVVVIATVAVAASSNSRAVSESQLLKKSAPRYINFKKNIGGGGGILRGGYYRGRFTIHRRC